MNQQSLRITAFDDSLWTGWAATEYGHTGLASRRLRSGQKHTLRLPLSETGELLAVLSFAAAPDGNPTKDWRILMAGQPVAIHHRKTFPKHLLIELPPVTSTEGAELVFEPVGPAKSEQDLLIEEIAVMPRAGRFSELWTSPTRALKKLAIKRSLPWAPADFPYSHFDGLGYLLERDEVRQAVLSRQYDTAFRYWYTKGRHEGHPLPLAVEREPLPGTPFNLVMHYKGEYEDGPSFTRTFANSGSDAASLHTLQEENDLLLLQLHQVQEEMEKVFVENKEFREAMNKISSELDAAKKSAAEKTMHISQLESRIDDQTERQTLIEEQLIKAEGQLELLKDLLRPALQ